MNYQIQVVTSVSNRHRMPIDSYVHSRTKIPKSPSLHKRSYEKLTANRHGIPKKPKLSRQI